MKKIVILIVSLLAIIFIICACAINNKNTDSESDSLYTDTLETTEETIETTIETTTIETTTETTTIETTTINPLIELFDECKPNFVDHMLNIQDVNNFIYDMEHINFTITDVSNPEAKLGDQLIREIEKQTTYYKKTTSEKGKDYPYDFYYIYKDGYNFILKNHYKNANIETMLKAREPYNFSIFSQFDYCLFSSIIGKSAMYNDDKGYTEDNNSSLDLEKILEYDEQGKILTLNLTKDENNTYDYYEFKTIYDMTNDIFKIRSVYSVSYDDINGKIGFEISSHGKIGTDEDAYVKIVLMTNIDINLVELDIDEAGIYECTCSNIICDKGSIVKAHFETEYYTFPATDFSYSYIDENDITEKYIEIADVDYSEPEVLLFDIEMKYPTFVHYTERPSLITTTYTLETTYKTSVSKNENGKLIYKCSIHLKSDELKYDKYAFNIYGNIVYNVGNVVKIPDHIISLIEKSIEEYTEDIVA